MDTSPKSTRTRIFSLLNFIWRFLFLRIFSFVYWFGKLVARAIVKPMLLRGAAIARILIVGPFSYLRRHSFVAGFVVAVLLLSGVMVYQGLLRAKIQDFYPGVCLGNWRNPQNAQGAPETFNLPKSPDAPAFNENNSAFFSGGHGQIFCGNFAPAEFQGEGEIHNVGLTLVWDIKGLTTPELPPAPIPDTAEEASHPDDEHKPSSTSSDPVNESGSEPPSGGEGESSAVDGTDSSAIEQENEGAQSEAAPMDPGIGDSSGETPVDAPIRQDSQATAEDPVEPTSLIERAFRAVGSAISWPMIFATAQEEQAAAPEVIEQVDSPVAETESPVQKSGDSAPLITPDVPPPPDSMEVKLEPLDTPSTTIIEGAHNPVVFPVELEPDKPPPLDDNFMKVVYSFDGQNWIELAKINPYNWRNFTITLPVRSWDELKRLQISVGGQDHALTDAFQVYLDGILVEVHSQTGPFGSREERVKPSAESDVPVIVVDEEDAPIPDWVKTDFRSDEAPQLDIILSDLPSPTSTLAIQATSSPPSSDDQEPPEPQDTTEQEGEGAEPAAEDPALPIPDPSEEKVDTTTSPSDDEISSTTPIAEQVQATTSPFIETFSSSSSDEAPPPQPPPTSTMEPSTVSDTPSDSGGISLGASLYRIAGALRGFFIWGTTAARAQERVEEGELPTRDNPVVTYVYGPDGRLANIDPIVVTTGDTLRVGLPQSGRTLKPGKYRVRLYIFQNNAIYQTDYDFTWGVFVVNFDKSIYAKGDIGTIGFGVLNDQGHTICNADLVMEVSSPSGKTSYFGTANGTISRNDTCGAQTVTNNPDYSATFAAQEAGQYTVRAVSQSVAGRKTLSDSFWVEDVPQFDVLRDAPTRIYPPAIYKVTLKIRASQDYSGTITESLPSSFQVIPEQFADRVISSDVQTLTWNVELKKGEAKSLSYFFDAPDISPELFKLGPLQIGAWQERRMWQIASDAANSRANTVIFPAGQFSSNGTTGKNSNTNHSLPTSTMRLGESNVTIKDAFVEVRMQLNGTGDRGNVTGHIMAFDACSSPCAPDPWGGSGRVEDNQTSTVLQYQDVGGGMWVKLLVDVTSETQLAAYTGAGGNLVYQVGYRVHNAATADTISSAKAKLYVTYTYASSSAQITQTVVYPLESTDAGASGSRPGTSTTACTLDSSCPTFTYNMRIPEMLASTTQRVNFWHEVGGMPDANGSTDNVQAINLQGTDVETSNFVLEAAQANDQNNWSEGWWGNGSGTQGFAENATTTLEHRHTGGSMYMVGGEVATTYTASSSASTKTRTVSFPIGVVTNGSVATLVSASTTVYFPETGVDIQKAWFRVIIAGDDANATGRNIQVSSKVGTNATSSAVTYTMNTGANVIHEAFRIIHVVSSTQYTELEGAGASTGKDVVLGLQANNATVRGMSAELMITYTYTGEANGYLTSLTLFGGQTTSTGDDQSETILSVLNSVIPESGVDSVTMRSAAVLGSFSVSDNDGAVTTAVVNADIDLATISPGCSSAFDGDSDGQAAFFEFYKIVTGDMNTTDNQSYSICYTNDGGGDATEGAKMNGMLRYTYQVDDASQVLTVTNVVLNSGNSIVLLPNTSTTVSVVASTSNPGGPGHISFATSTFYRSGVTSTYACNPHHHNCYQVGSSSCVFYDATSSVRCDASLWYLADATDASSTYPSEQWAARITVRNASGTTASGNGASSTVELLTLSAINVTTSSIHYGSLLPGTDTTSTNQITTVYNAGNSSTTLNISALSRLTSGSNYIPTSSQRYSTSTFTYSGTSTAMSDTSIPVGGWITLGPPGARTWPSTTQVPGAGTQDFGICLAHKGYMYIVGGFAPGEAESTTTVLYAPIRVDGTLGSWATTTPIVNSGGGIGIHAVAAYGNYLYAGGGNPPGADNVTSTLRFAPINATGSIGAWTNTTPIPGTDGEGLNQFAMIAHNGYLYYLAGRDVNGPNTSTVAFAPINATGSIGAWTQTSPLTDSRTDPEVAIYGDYIYLSGGGASGSGYATTTMYARINATGSLGAWATAARMPYGIDGFGFVAAGGLLYSYGGYDGTAYRNQVHFAVIQPNGAPTYHATTTALMGDGHSACSVGYNGYLYQVGGAANPNEVYYSKTVAQNIYWGVQAPGGTAPGTYTATNVFTAVFSP